MESRFRKTNGMIRQNFGFANCQKLEMKLKLIAHNFFQIANAFFNDLVLFIVLVE